MLNLPSALRRTFFLYNDLPFEWRAPVYNFLGPGTKINIKLIVAFVVVNTVDQTAQEHDNDTVFTYQLDIDVYKRQR